MIYNNIGKQKRLTFLIILGFISFLTLFLYFVSLFFLNSSIFIVIFAATFSIITSFITYYNSDKIVLKLNGARPATNEENRQLKLLLEGLLIASGLPEPKLYIIDDMSLNAFATGRNPENSVICVTKGLIEKLDKYELEAVLAHELSHIKNYDILISTVIAVMAGFVVIIADFFTRRMFYGRRNKNSENSKGNEILLLIGLIFIILSPIFTKIIQMLVSRKREYLADATAVSFTRNKDGMINALLKIEQDNDILEVANKSTAHMFFSEPIKKLNAKKKKKTSLFDTHPSITERVKAIKELI